MTSSPHEVLDRIEMADREAQGAPDCPDQIAEASLWATYGPRLVAVARAALDALEQLDEDGVERLYPLHRVRENMRAALTALGGPDAPQEKPE